MKLNELMSIKLMKIFLLLGVVVRPPVSSMFYIPQRPYMTIGTLRDQVLYPHHTKYGSSTFSKKHSVTDEELNELMRQVELSYLVAREGWDKQNDWNEVLSQGEQQVLLSLSLSHVHNL
jgi:ABC-type uncharacterized transport system fused permease/ATPase subunit